MKLAPKPPLEKDIHIQINDLIEATHSPGVIWYHSANEIRTTAWHGRQRKRMGVKAGVPDFTIHVPEGNSGSRTHYMEVKRLGGRLSVAQKAFIAEAEAIGISCWVAYSIEDAQFILKHIGAIR